MVLGAGSPGDVSSLAPLFWSTMCGVDAILSDSVFRAFVRLSVLGIASRVPLKAGGGILGSLVLSPLVR